MDRDYVSDALSIWETDIRADPWNLVLIPWQEPLQLFRRYLADMESFLEAEAQECEAGEQDIWRKIESGEIAAPTDPGAVPTELQYYHHRSYELEVFANMVRSSLFVSLCGFLESELVKWCQDGSGFGRGNLVQQATRRLIVDNRRHQAFKRSREWQELANYQLLRNCIVHHRGELLSYQHAAKLREYIRDRPPAMLSLADNDKIVLGNGFGKEATDTIERYLVIVYVLISGRV